MRLLAIQLPALTLHTSRISRGSRHKSHNMLKCDSWAFVACFPMIEVLISSRGLKFIAITFAAYIVVSFNIMLA